MRATPGVASPRLVSQKGENVDTRDKSIMLSYAKDIVCAMRSNGVNVDDSDAMKMAERFCAWLITPNTLDEILSRLVRKAGLSKACAERKVPISSLVALYVDSRDPETFIAKLKEIAESWQE